MRESIIKMKKVFLLLFVLMAGGSLYSQQVAGAENGGMGLVSAGVDNFWSVYNNQAGMAYYNQTTVGLDYINHFGMPELSTKVIAATLPALKGVFGISYSHIGMSVANQQTFGLAYAKRLGKRFAAGIKMNYVYSYQQGVYTDYGVLLFEAGLMAKPLKGLTVGAHVYNPSPVFLSEYSYRELPVILRVGTQYEVSEKLNIALEIYQSSFYKPQVMTGLEYSFEVLTARVGYATFSSLLAPWDVAHYGSFFFGTGFVFNDIHIDISTSMNQYLGWSPQISMHYSFK